MEQLRIFSKLFNTLFPFSDFLYILQQEEYSNERLMRWLPRFFLRRNIQVRGKLQYTQRVWVTLFISILTWVSLYILVLVMSIPLIIKITLLLALLLSIPYTVAWGNWLASFRYDRIKKDIRYKAIEKVRQNKQLKVVTIAGSFGKTTVKNFVQQLVSASYKTQMLPGNINTTPGIAAWINNNLQPTTEILIMEVDAYHKGEVARSSSIAPADIAAILNFGDQHLERLKTRTNLIQSLTEAFEIAKPHAKLLALKETWSNVTLSAEHTSKTKIIINPTITTYQGKKLEIPALSESNKINISFALTIAEILDVPYRFVVDTLERLVLPDRRQKITTLLGYTIVDDSYNISFTTAKAGITQAKLLATSSNRKLLVITAGIPELGVEIANKNVEFGGILASQADKILLLQSMLAPDVYSGMQDKSKVVTLPSFAHAISYLKERFSPDEWVVLLQPELNDLYY